MSSWTVDELIYWDERICETAAGMGLDWFDIDYEIIDYQEMLGAMAYTGLPTHYRHWSFGKEYERTHTLYNLGMTGLPYEMIINSNPSIAYLMTENPLSTHILTMAHCVGHSDFFRQNRMFHYTNPDDIISKFKAAAKYVRELIEDPSIGIDEVEKVLDAAHSIKYQVPRTPGITYKSRDEWTLIQKRMMQLDPTYHVDLEKTPFQPEYNLLQFISEHSRNLKDWQRNLITIVEDNSKYFIPQALTKVMNEGWACTIHQRIINEMEIPDEYHLAFLKLHNQVVRPHLGKINPYHLGFELFQKIIKEEGFEEAKLIREVHNDMTFLRNYIDEEFVREQNLFTYSFKKQHKYNTIDEIGDQYGWKSVRDELIKNVGLSRVPVVYVEDLSKDFTLTLIHEHDGRDLELKYAQRVFEYIQQLWGDKIKLVTEIENEVWEF
jgi:stage V sporulation protein R